MSIRLRNLSIGIALIMIVVVPVFAFANASFTNGGFNYPYVDTGRIWRDQTELVAEGWHQFWIAENTYHGDASAEKIHWMSAAQFATYFSGINYRIEGDQAQNMWSSYEFDAGVYQQIDVTSGQDYAFDVAMVTYWRGPGYPDTDGVMVKMVGIDPYGGTDPTSTSVIWSDTDSNDKFWVYMDVAATAQSNTMTVFAKVSAPNNFNHTDLDMVYFDAAHFDLAPFADNLKLVSTSATVTANWTGGAQSGWNLKGYEAQYREDGASAWITLQPKDDSNTTAQFSGEYGKTYHVRVRAWQTKSEGYNSDIDMPGVWQSQTITLGGVLNGTVLNNTENAISGATVAISGTPTQTTSAAGGAFSFVTGEGTFGITATTPVGWTSPSPVWVDVPLTDTTAITLTLRPPNNFIDNGDFDGSLSGWSSTFSSPIFDTNTPRAGSHSLCLTETGTLTATAIVTDMYRPTLSFWARVIGDGDDSLSALIFAPDGFSQTTPITLTQNSDWQHVVLPLNLLGAPTSGGGNFDGGTGTFLLPRAEVYSGSLGVSFTVLENGAPTQFCLDEVSAGSAWGGPEKVFLPLVMR